MSPTIDPNNSAELAVALTQLRADQTILQREVASNIQNLTSATDAMQAELRHVGSKLEDVARLQQQQVSHSEGLNRAFKAIEKLANSFESWRERHEGENRVTSDCVTEAKGALRGTQWAFGILGTVVTGLITTVMTMAWLNVSEKLADAKAERAMVEQRRQRAHDQDVMRLQQQIAELSARVNAQAPTRGAP